MKINHQSFFGMKLYLHSTRGRAGGRDGEKNESALKGRGLLVQRGLIWDMECLGWAGRGGRRRKMCWEMDGDCRGHRDMAEVGYGPSLIPVL